MSIIKCRFERYESANKNDSRLLRLFLLLCEQLQLPFPVTEKTFDLDTNHPELFLDPDRPFFVSKNLIGSEKDELFRAIKTSVRYRKSHTVQIDLLLEEIRPSPIARWFESLEEEQKGAWGGSFFCLSILLTGVVIYPFAAFPEPLWLWSWIGIHFIGLIQFSVLFLIITFGMSWIARMQSQILQSTAFAGAIIISLMIIVGEPLLTKIFGTPPQSGSPQAYIDYLHSLWPSIGARFAFVVAVVPWVAILLKWLGYDLAASAVKQALSKGDGGGD